MPAWPKAPAFLSQVGLSIERMFEWIRIGELMRRVTFASVRIDFGAFLPDNRGNRLEDYKFVRTKLGVHCVLLRGPVGVAHQVKALAGGIERPLPDQFRPQFNRCLQLGGEPTPALKQLLELLRRVVTLPTSDELDLALALDFYKDPTSDEDPMKWVNTPAGELVNRAKYRLSSDAAKELVSQLTQVIQQHPDYAASDVILSVPGHKPTSRSFGLYLAEGVAEASGKQHLKTLAKSAERPPAKEIGYTEQLQLENEFIVPSEAKGTRAVVIDDVYHSGASTRAVAAAARRVGVAEVRALVGARTMRS